MAQCFTALLSQSMRNVVTRSLPTRSALSLLVIELADTDTLRESGEETVFLA